MFQFSPLEVLYAVVVIAGVGAVARWLIRRASGPAADCAGRAAGSDLGRAASAGTAAEPHACRHR